MFNKEEIKKKTRKIGEKEDKAVRDLRRRGIPFQTIVNRNRTIGDLKREYKKW